MTHLIPSPSWLDAALEFCITKTRHNLATLTSFPERTEGGQWVQIDPDRAWLVGGWALGGTALAGLRSHRRSVARSRCPRLGQPPVASTERPGRPRPGFSLRVGIRSRLSADRRRGSQAAWPCKPPRSSAAVLILVVSTSRPGAPLDASPELRGRTIMDTMMNLDLLFWAGKETGDPRYAEIAAAHARTTLTHHLRPDGSTSHVCDFDPETGAFLKQDTHQGMSATSCWSRGQAWGVYGFADCYRATGDPAFLECQPPPDGVSLAALARRSGPILGFRQPAHSQRCARQFGGLHPGLGSALLWHPSKTIPTWRVSGKTGRSASSNRSGKLTPAATPAKPAC